MEKLREAFTSNGTKLLAGKDAESNEALVEQVSKQEEVFHTRDPGSPFVNIKGKPQRGDLKEAAIFCAKYSQAWKKHKKNPIEVHQFKGKDMFKESKMKTGTFGVKKYKVIKVRKEEIENANFNTSPAR